MMGSATHFLLRDRFALLNPIRVRLGTWDALNAWGPADRICVALGPAQQVATGPVYPRDASCNSLMPAMRSGRVDTDPEALSNRGPRKCNLR